MDALVAFEEAVRRRLWSQAVLGRILWATVLVGVLILAIATVSLANGRAVPHALYGLGLILWVVALLAILLGTRCRPEVSAAFADAFFRLSDALTSARRFASEEKDGGFYALQRKRTEELVSRLDPESVPVAVSPMLCFATMGAILLVGGTALVPDSEATVHAKRQALAIQAQTEALNAELSETLEAFARETPEPMGLLPSGQWREWLSELRTTDDLKVAMRQYAALERRVSQLSGRLEQRREEQLMNRIGEELLRERGHEQLGDQLKRRKYRDAAARLREMQMRGREKGMTKLSEKRERFEHWRSAARRMAAAAQENQDRSETSPALEALLEQLNALTETLGGEWQQLADVDDTDVSAMDEEALRTLLEKMEALDLHMEEMSLRLERMEATRDLQGKLRMLGRQLSQAQRLLAGRVDAPFTSPGAPRPGDGHSEERREAQDAVVDNGQFTELKGLKGIGPSQTQIEDSTEGTGVSQLSATGRERDYAKQLEAFVQRDDVPEQVKSAVREYFTRIHQIPPATEPDGTDE